MQFIGKQVSSFLAVGCSSASPYLTQRCWQNGALRTSHQNQINRCLVQHVQRKEFVRCPAMAFPAALGTSVSTDGTQRDPLRSHCMRTQGTRCVPSAWGGGTRTGIHFDNDNEDIVFRATPSQLPWQPNWNVLVCVSTNPILGATVCVCGAGSETRAVVPAGTPRWAPAAERPPEPATAINSASSRPPRAQLAKRLQIKMIFREAKQVNRGIHTFPLQMFPAYC